MSAVKEYTLCFLTHRGEQVLLLNRLKAPWMGNWNGVGGKLDPHESPLQCALREVEEETGFPPDAYTVVATGRMRWTEEGVPLGILYLYLMELHAAPDMVHYPQATREGILAFRPLDWTVSQRNTGVVPNVPVLLPALQSSAADDRADKQSVEFLCDCDRAGRMVELVRVA